MNETRPNTFKCQKRSGSKSLSVSVQIDAEKRNRVSTETSPKFQVSKRHRASPRRDCRNHRSPRLVGRGLMLQIARRVRNGGGRNPGISVEKFSVLFGVDVSLHIEDGHLTGHHESVNVVVAARLQLQTSLISNHFARVMSQIEFDAVNLIFLRRKKNEALEIDAPLEVSQTFVERRRVRGHGQTLQSGQHVSQYLRASWHPPDSATIPNVVPKGVHVQNSLFSTLVFFFVLGFLFETRHFLTERTFCVSVKDVPQMTSFVQVQGQAGGGFSQFQRQKMKLWERNDSQTKGQIETRMTNGGGGRSIGSQNFRHPSSVLEVVQTVTAVLVVVVVVVFLLARRRGRPQGFHRSTHEVLIKNSTAFVRLGLHDKLTPVGKTNVSVFSLHDRHSSVLGVPTAAAAAMGFQTSLQIRQILRIRKRNVVVESEQFAQTRSLRWRGRRRRRQSDPGKLRRVVVLAHQSFAASRNQPTDGFGSFAGSFGPKSTVKQENFFSFLSIHQNEESNGKAGLPLKREIQMMQDESNQRKTFETFPPRPLDFGTPTARNTGCSKSENVGLSQAETRNLFCFLRRRALRRRHVSSDWTVSSANSGKDND